MIRSLVYEGPGHVAVRHREETSGWDGAVRVDLDYCGVCGTDVHLHHGRLSGVPADEREARIPELLDQVDMTEWRQTKLKKFSKGMMQRVGLAQALLNDPDLIFLDEPTINLDENRRVMLAEQLSKIDGLEQLFVISHDDTFIEESQHVIRVTKNNGVSEVAS